MDLTELSERLVPFCREHLGDPEAAVANVETMPGHAGFSFGFTATSKGESRSYVLRVPPPNVRRVGTADVNPAGSRGPCAARHGGARRERDLVG